MSVLNGTINDLVAGDDLDVKRTITDIPAGQTLVKGWLTFKGNLNTADPGLLQKVITATPVVDVGQITDAGASGTGAVLFQLTKADTAALPIGKPTAYDIQVKTSAGKIYTAERGTYLSLPGVTDATT